MAKRTEMCPKCGSGRTQFEGQTSWKCGSFSMYVPGLNPFWALSESEYCQARQELAAANAEIERLRALSYAAQEFLSPEEWRFEQPSHKPGLDARLHDLEHAVDSALGDGWRDRHAANVAELAAKFRPNNEGAPHA